MSAAAVPSGDPLKAARWQPAAPPCLTGVLRSAPEDFLVDEVSSVALTGAGEHVWLRIRKRGANTEFVARQLARIAGVPPRAVGYAGLKDRHAVTTQWFSVHLPGAAAPEWQAQLPPGVELLEATRHARKLQTGALEANRFTIIVREVEGERERLAARLETIAGHGVPNYFGEQRFGYGGENVERARAMFAGQIEPDRHRRGIYLSAARSFLFNEVLAERVADGSWCRLLEGEAVALDGSRSFFVADGIEARAARQGCRACGFAEQIDDTLRERLARHDVHPSGPLWGAGELPTRAGLRQLEEAVAARHAALAAGLAAAGLKQERRALRLIPQGLEAHWRDAATLELRFTLPAGAYATTVLREIVDYRETAPRGE